MPGLSAGARVAPITIEGRDTDCARRETNPDRTRVSTALQTQSFLVADRREVRGTSRTVPLNRRLRPALLQEHVLAVGREHHVVAELRFVSPIRLRAVGHRNDESDSPRAAGGRSRLV